MVLTKMRIKAALWWLNFKNGRFVKWLAGGGVILVVVILVTIAALYGRDNRPYFYVDKDGNKGVSDLCRGTEGGLVCQLKDREGWIEVQQFYR